ncbi:MAG: hypothetical protein IPL40_05205 [Proteobacteria bacterium]|nr:hypothetical protein [Pseudomonadota bacterium]
MPVSGRPTWPLCVVALAALGCGDGLSVKGRLDRVIGEPLTIELIEGKPTFGSDVTLVDAAGKVFEADALRARLVSPRELSCLIPRGAQVGPARLRLPRQGTSSEYAIPLTVSRLLIALDEAGAVHALPLAGSVVAGAQLDTARPVAQLSLSPSGGQLAVVTVPSEDAPHGQLRLYALAAEPRLLHTLDLEQAPAAVAATDDGVVVATAAQLAFYRADRENGLQTAFTAALAQVQGLAVAAEAPVAAVLLRCDSNNDGTVDADCVARLALDREDAAQQLSATTVLDSTPSARLIALRRDGLAVVVADTQVVYGVLYDGATARVTAQAWDPSPAEPTSIDDAPSGIGDIFAISDRRNGVVFVVGFNPAANNDLGVVRRSPVLDIAPVALSFGRGTDLLVASPAGGIFGLDVATGKSTDQALLMGPSAGLRTFVTQR